MKILSVLKRIKHRGQGVCIYLTNTLGSSEDIEIDMLGALAQEAKRASEAKSKTRIMVVIGNPPWSAINKAKLDDRFIKEKMDAYRGIKVTGMHSLGDPYVKFIRFAQHKIEQNGSGVVGMIVNNSFLADMGFEGMRRELARVFDKIMVYNLHGSPKIDRDDENVFDITVPNAIVIMIKLPKELRTEGVTCSIEYDEVRGTRAEKFDALRHGKNDWKPLHPEDTEQFLFVPHKVDRTYEGWMRLDEIFRERFTGSNTHRDRFATAFDKETIRERIGDFVSAYVTDVELMAKYGLKSKKDWEIKNQRAKARHEGLREDLIREYSYRPFDLRLAYFSDHVMGARRGNYDDVGDTLSICVPRSSHSDPWSAVHMSRGMADIKFCEYKIPSHMFPLKMRSQRGYGTRLIDGEHGDEGKKFDYNFSETFIHFFSRKYDGGVSGEDAFYYIYGVLHTPAYRERYGGYLRQGFPRIPFINIVDDERGDSKLLVEVARLGRELANYHTMTKTTRPSDSKIKWAHSDTEVSKTQVSDDGGTVRARFGKYVVTGIPWDVWNYDIGSRKVLKEVIKRLRLKGSVGLEDRQHFLSVCGAIAKTMEIQHDLNGLLVGRLPSGPGGGQHGA